MKIAPKGAASVAVGFVSVLYQIRTRILTPVMIRVSSTLTVIIIIIDIIVVVVTFLIKVEGVVFLLRHSSWVPSNLMDDVSQPNQRLVTMVIIGSDEIRCGHDCDNDDERRQHLLNSYRQHSPGM